MDWIDADDTAYPYRAGDPVLLRQPERHWKLQPPYEVGWVGWWTASSRPRPYKLPAATAVKSWTTTCWGSTVHRKQDVTGSSTTKCCLFLVQWKISTKRTTSLAVEPAGHRMILRERGTLQLPLRFQNWLTVSWLAVVCCFVRSSHVRSSFFFVFLFFCFCMRCYQAEDCDGVYYIVGSINMCLPP